MTVFLRGLGFVAVHRLSVVGESRGYSLVMCGLLAVVASLAAELGLYVQGLQELWCTGFMPRGMWDLPGPGIKSMSLASAGGFPTTEPPGKSICVSVFKKFWLCWVFIVVHRLSLVVASGSFSLVAACRLSCSAECGILIP